MAVALLLFVLSTGHFQFDLANVGTNFEAAFDATFNLLTGELFLCVFGRRYYMRVEICGVTLSLTGRVPSFLPSPSSSSLSSASPSIIIIIGQPDRRQCLAKPSPHRNCAKLGVLVLPPHHHHHRNFLGRLKSPPSFSSFS